MANATLKERLESFKGELKQDKNRVGYYVVLEAISEIERLEEKHDFLGLIDELVILRARVKKRDEKVPKLSGEELSKLKSDLYDHLSSDGDFSMHDGVTQSLVDCVDSFLDKTFGE